MEIGGICNMHHWLRWYGRPCLSQTGEALLT